MDSTHKIIIERAADPEGGAHQLELFFKALRDARLALPPRSDPGLAALLHLFGNAPAFTHFLITHPDEALRMIARLRGEHPRQIFIPDDAPLENRLRRMRLSEWAMALAERLAGRLPADQLGRRLTGATDAILKTATGTIFEETGRRRGWLSRWRPTPTVPIGVIALGKLGAVDLNVSSDIDLVMVGPGDQQLGSVANRLTEDFVRLLSATGPEGFIFRVDLALRPGGSKGPLVTSIDSMESYYELYGEDWERMALIRARPVAGDPALGTAFQAMVAPFVWRKSFDPTAIKKLQELKQRAEAQLAGQKHKTFHLKLSPGGIREIEYTVQLLQLAYGGADLKLRTHDLRAAIDRLGETDRLPGPLARSLKDAYNFMRHAENCLQMEQDLQIYLLPFGDSGREQLAVRMQIKGQTRSEQRDRLETELDRHAQTVRRIFTQLFP